MNLNSYTDVLIVGAGPTGLMMACQLAINNIPFRIIDKNEDHTNQSRALVVQARSIEIFDQMGIAEKAIRQGQVAKAIGAFFNGKKVLRLIVNNVGEGLTKFPYFLMLEQSRTESLLVDFLETRGYHVERRKQLINITQNDKEAIVVLKLPVGKDEIVKSKYVIGADGAHSNIREQLKIDFLGSTYEQSLFVLDCKAEVDIPHDEMYLTFAKTAVGGLFPLTNGRWRVLGNLPEELEGKEEVRFEEIEKNFAERIQMNIRLYDPHWISVYRTHHRYASTFRRERCFLIGDAAHIHSPVGAQGMNTGLQDAYNLAWKLSLVIEGRAKDSLLDTYTEERISIARDLVRSTDRAFNLFSSPSIILRAFRLHIIPIGLKLVVPVFLKFKVLQQFAFNSLSKNASLGSFPNHAPKPGDRLPFIQFKNESGRETNIQKKVKSNSFSLFVFSDKAPKSLKSFKNTVSFETIPFTMQTKILYDKLGLNKDGCYLIRPDMYIAYRSNKFDPEHLTKYLKQFLHK
jgi:2-polyprenyl-6-methoxyphenol hydroxylase-like FAD-dependent oxidoreductase